MPRHLDLPDEFARRPFSVRDATVAGVGRGRLRGADLSTPFRGSRDSGGTVPDDALVVFRRRCAALHTLMPPSQFFSHTTAAALWGCPTSRAIMTEDLHVSTRAPARAPRRIGVTGHQITDSSVVSVDRFGLPVADAASVFLQLAAIVSLEELIVAGDYLIQDPPVLDPWDIRPHTTLDELGQRTGMYRGRGRVHAVQALALMRVGAESRMETLLRLILYRAGLPEPGVNLRLTGIRRRWHHRADLVYVERRVIVEYDGDQHRTSTRQYEEDMRRFDDFVHDGWELVRVRQYGVLTNPSHTVDRVRSALAVGGRMPS